MKREVILQGRERLIVDLNMAVTEKGKLLSTIKGLDKRIEGLKVEIEAIRLPELTVSKHAIQRFKERIMDMPDDRIRKMLTDEKILDRYESKGAGCIPFGYDNAYIAVVEDYTIKTVYLRNDPMERLKALAAYMDNWVEDRIKQVYDPTWNIMHFKTFRNKIYFRA